jgi:hypothetical protein
MSDTKVWVYKNHTCKIELHYESDNIKAWHTVTKPDGTVLFADITPYDSEPETLNLWIDANYPEREKGRYPTSPLHLEDIQDIIKSQLP